MRELGGLNLHVLRMFKDTFLLDMADMVYNNIGFRYLSNSTYI